MLNRLWFGFFICGFVASLFSWLVLGDVEVFNRVIRSLFEMANLSVEIAIGLVGLLVFWGGMIRLAEVGGLANGLARLLHPLFTKLMPEVPKGHPALGLISMNMAANMMGLDNAATPIGLKAIQSLQQLNSSPLVATNAQILFLVLNTSSVTIFPITVIMYRLQQGAEAPASVFLPILLATSISTLCGLIAVALVQRINLFDRVIVAYLAVGFGLLGGIVYAISDLPSAQMTAISAAFGNGLLFTAIIIILLRGWWRKVAVYDEFIEGAKGGFELAVSIIPYLVAMLVAIGVMRASGLLQGLVEALGWLAESAGFNTEFVKALPTAIMRPFSASGSRAMMLETMDLYGVDSFPARLAAVIQGSTETTFYVLTVYFGSVGIQRVRHAIGCGLLADLGGIIAAIIISYWFFF